ncbi:MAG: DUF2946 family protein [Hyphomicrobium sp.]
MLALFGVMLHAYALTAHHGRAMAMAFAAADANPGAVVICRADGSVATIAFDDLLAGGAGKSSKAQHCPLCCGATPAFAVAAPAPIVLAYAPRTVDKPLIIDSAALPIARAARPPATGPPARV